MTDQFRVRQEVLDFKPYVAGRSIEEIKAELGLATVVKLASNENPLGASPVVRKAIEAAAATVFRYPRAGNPELNTAIARSLGVASERVIAGNGSDEIIDLLVRGVCTPGRDHVLAFRPCFSVYGLQARVAGVEFRQVPLNDDFSFPFTALAEAANEDTGIVFVTNPDNPSGHTVQAGELAELARALPERTLLVVDEAYIHFAEDMAAVSPLGMLDELPNICLLRTFSKAYGLAGLRLGYGVLPAELTQYLLRIQIPFSVNILAVQAGLAALSDEAFLAQTLRTVKEGRAWLREELSRLGCAPLPSQANFLMFTPPVEAAAVVQGVLERGVIIRPLTSYGLANHIRVSVGTMEENRAFIDALEQTLEVVS